MPKAGWRELKYGLSDSSDGDEHMFQSKRWEIAGRLLPSERRRGEDTGGGGNAPWQILGLLIVSFSEFRPLKRGRKGGTLVIRRFSTHSLEQEDPLNGLEGARCNGVCDLVKRSIPLDPRPVHDAQEGTGYCKNEPDRPSLYIVIPPNSEQISIFEQRDKATVEDSQGDETYSCRTRSYEGGHCVVRQK